MGWLQARQRAIPKRLMSPGCRIDATRQWAGTPIAPPPDRGVEVPFGKHSLGNTIWTRSSSSNQTFSNKVDHTNPMNQMQRKRLALAVASALGLACGAAGARSVTVSANGGPGDDGLRLPCSVVSMSVAAVDCYGFDRAGLSVERTNLLMDVLSGVSRRTAWTDPFSGIIGPEGNPYTPFIAHTDSQVAAGGGSENSLFDATFGLSEDGSNIVGTLTLLRAFQGPFVLGLSGLIGTGASFSGIYLYTGSDFEAGARIDITMPNVPYTFAPAPGESSGCGGNPGEGGIGPGISGNTDNASGAGGVLSIGSIVSSSTTGNGCPPPPSFAVRLTGATIFEDPGYRVPVSGTLGLALAGLALLGWNRRQRAAAMAAR